MDKHYIVFNGGTHSVVILLRAGSIRAALELYILEQDTDAVLRPDGTIELRYGRSEIVYEHPLAYIEAMMKSRNEWQIREVSEKAWELDCTEAFCGENPYEVEEAIDGARAELRKSVPRSRAPGFIWYLCEGMLITYYRRVRPFQIEIVGRYFQDNEGNITKWTGTYDEIMNRLWGPQPLVSGLLTGGSPPEQRGWRRV